MELLRILAMPFQPTSLVFVAGSSLLLGLVLGSGNFITVLMGLWATWIILVWLTRYAFRMFDDVANGVRAATVAEVEMANPFGDARCWVHPVLAMGLIILHGTQPDLPVTPTLALAALLFPPSMAASAMSGHARDALNPAAVLQVITGLGPWYPVMVAAVAGCAALGALAARHLEIGWLFFAIAELLLLVTYAAMGGLVYLRRVELGFAARVSPERRDERVEQARLAERQKLLDNVFEQLRGKHPDRALAAATQWLRADQPHQLVTDVQALLAAGRRWQQPREFATLVQGLVPLLLTKSQPALALAAADAALGQRAGFAPADEPMAVALIEYALQTGRRRTATQLLDNFLEAHPAETLTPRLATLQERLRPYR